MKHNAFVDPLKKEKNQKRKEKSPLTGLAWTFYYPKKRKQEKLHLPWTCVTNVMVHSHASARARARTHTHTHISTQQSGLLATPIVCVYRGRMCGGGGVTGAAARSAILSGHVHNVLQKERYMRDRASQFVSRYGRSRPL